jgi:hypothetical protein
MTVNAGMLAAVATQLESQSVPAALRQTLLASIDAAGYTLAPSGGGSAVAIVDQLACAVYAVAGRPGVHLVEVTLPNTEKLRWIEIFDKNAGIIRLKV